MCPHQRGLDEPCDPSCRFIQFSLLLHRWWLRSGDKWLWVKWAHEPLWHDGYNTCSFQFHLKEMFGDELGGEGPPKSLGNCSNHWGLRWRKSLLLEWNNASCEYKSSCLISEWGPSTLNSLRPDFCVWVLIMGSPGLLYYADMNWVALHWIELDWNKLNWKAYKQVWISCWVPGPGGSQRHKTVPVFTLVGPVTMLMWTSGKNT